MVQSINDCHVLIAGGMSYGACESMRSRNIEAVVTDVIHIDESVELYLKG